MDSKLGVLLQKVGVWNQVDKATADYLQNINDEGPEFAVASLVLKFTYNYSDLALISEPLLRCITTEPWYYEYLLHETILEAVNSNLKAISSPFQVKIEQIHSIQRLIGLPLIEHFRFYPTIKKSLSNFTCVVTGRSDVEMRMRHTVWYCEFKCPCNVITRGIQLDSNLTMPICKECRSSMKEYVKLRDMREHVMLSVLPLQSVQTPRSIGKVYDKFMVHLSDDLARRNYIVGNAYTITGVYDGIQRMFNAWHIVELKDV